MALKPTVSTSILKNRQRKILECVHKLEAAFVWDDSPQGHEFWAGVWGQLKRVHDSYMECNDYYEVQKKTLQWKKIRDEVAKQVNHG